MDKLIWLILMIVFLMVETSAVTLVSVWFAVGALAALISALLGAELWVQIVLFFAVSVLALASLRPILRKFFVPKLTPTNVDSVIGATGLVTADIDNITAQGQVKLGGMEWTARSTSGAPIEKGTQIQVDKVEGVKVFVSPVQVDAPV
jgi:membrane protein implicated in regulation of membrane protease activity